MNARDIDEADYGTRAQSAADLGHDLLDAAHWRTEHDALHRFITRHTPDRTASAA